MKARSLQLLSASNTRPGCRRGATLQLTQLHPLHTLTRQTITMPDYILIKYLHVATVIISGTGFTLRLGLMLWRETGLNQRAVKILPHVNDTLLLASGITLAVLSAQYPLAQGWLTAKLIALVIYILLGMLALKPRFARPVRLGFGLLALLVFAYIVSVALARQAWPL